MATPQEYFCCNVDAGLGTCEGHKLSESKPSEAIIVPQRTFESLYRLLKENKYAQSSEYSFHRRSLTALKHCSKSPERHSGMNTGCRGAVPQLPVGEHRVSEHRACALLRWEASEGWEQPTLPSHFFSEFSFTSKVQFLEIKPGCKCGL